MDTEEEEGSKLLSNPSFEVEHDDDDSANVTAKTTVVDSGGEFGKDTDTQCEPESAVELSESEPPQQPQSITHEGGDSIGDELVESRVDDEDGGAESREDSQPLAALVVGAEDGGFVAGEGEVEDVLMDGGDSSVPVAVAVGEGNDEEETGKEENPEVEREVADTVLETDEKDEEADDTGVKADVAEEMEEKADAAEEMEEKADAAEETEGRTAVGEETGEMTEVGEETKEIVEEIKVIDATEVEDTEITEEVDAADLVKDTAAVADETEFDDVEERMEMQEEETEVAGEAGETDSAEEMEKETEEAEETELREETDVEMETGDMAEETDEAEADETEKADVAEETEEAEADETEKADVAEEMEVGEEVEEVSKTAGGKRKRGGKNSKSPGRAPSRKKAEEDVCFICFDGGELVLCDRRGCPKAYHPACVNRDEAFFRAKGRWNCGVM